MTFFTRSAALSVLAAFAITTVHGHGFCTAPRMRGALNSQRNIPDAVMDPKAPIDYCAHCNNCGGVGSVKEGGPWKMFAPFDYKREGITMCGDPTGNIDHTRDGKFANPPSMPYAASYKPGSIANFEYDFTTNHNGFLSFFLCDVSATGDVENSKEYFNKYCYELERSPHPDCEAGTDRECGPIDPKYPGRWVAPCNKAVAGGDQLFGGVNGKMAYKIPDVEIADAVIINYWLTQNSCSTPDNFMQDYNYPAAWAGCPGDGGSIGGKPDFKDCVSVGRTPEEFFGCSDVSVTGSASGGPVGPRRISAAADDVPNKKEDVGEVEKVEMTEAKPSPEASYANYGGTKGPEPKRANGSYDVSSVAQCLTTCLF